MSRPRPGVRASSDVLVTPPGQNGSSCSAVAVRLERDTAQGPEANAREPMLAPGQQVGAGDWRLKSEWHQEVRAGQEGAGGSDDLGAMMFRSESEPQLSWSLCTCVHTWGGGRGSGQRAGISKSWCKGKAMVGEAARAQLAE